MQSQRNPGFKVEISLDLQVMQDTRCSIDLWDSDLCVPEKKFTKLSQVLLAQIVWPPLETSPCHKTAQYSPRLSSTPVESALRRGNKSAGLHAWCSIWKAVTVCRDSTRSQMVKITVFGASSPFHLTTRWYASSHLSDEADEVVSYFHDQAWLSRLDTERREAVRSSDLWRHQLLSGGALLLCVLPFDIDIDIWVGSTRIVTLLNYANS